MTAATNQLFRRMARNADTFATRCAFQASLRIVAGIDTLDFNDVKPPRRSNQHRQDPRSVPFREALYLTVVHFERSQRSLSRVLGISQVAVLKAISAVEKNRDDPDYDRRLDELELMLMGAA
jgi:hypothetical protein